MNLLTSKLLIVILASTSGLALASPGAPVNWAETLQDALTLNNKPKSKDAILEAQKDLTRVARDQMLPTVSAGYSRTQQPSANFNNGISSPSNLSTGSLSAQATWTIFQCGYNYYNFKAAQIDEKIMADQFNSTQFFIPNTKGGVVASAFQSYKTLIQLNEEIKLFPLISEYLAILKPIAAQDPDAQTALDITNQQMQRQLTHLQQSHDSAVFVYNHWVTVDPSPDIFDLQQAIDELEIPAAWEQAYQVAIQKSPDVRQASEQIAKAQLQIKAAKAASCPQVQAQVSYNSVTSRDPFNNINGLSRGPTYGIQITIPLFNRANRDNRHYQERMLKADQLAQQAALDDAQFNLKQTYRDLSDQLSNQQATSSLVKQLVASIRSTENDIKNQQHLPNPTTSGAVNSYINSKLSLLGNLADTWGQLASIKTDILTDKFSVLQAEGTLFDGDYSGSVGPAGNPYNLP